MPYPWHRLSSIVCHLCPPSLPEIIKIFSGNIYYIPGLCLLGIGGAPYISHKIIAQKTCLTSLKQPACGVSYNARRLPKPRPSCFVQIIMKLHLQAFWQNTLNMEKCKNLVSVCKTFKTLLLKNYSTEFLRY